MENLVSIFAVAGSLYVVLCAPLAAENARESDAALGLQELRESYNLSEGSCALGFLGTGSPITITRVAEYAADVGIVTGDRLIAINNRDTRDPEDLRETLGDLRPGQRATLVIDRDSVAVRIAAACADATPALRAREQALLSASQGDWGACVSATYLEEILWGGPNSESAGLRLWCHEAEIAESRFGVTRSGGRQELSRLHVQFLYEHASRLIEETQFSATDISAVRGIVGQRIQRIEDAGNLSLAIDLQARIAAMGGE